MAFSHALKVDQEGIPLEGMEKRHPRERFTKQLIKMCRALDNAAQHDFEIDDYDEICKGHMEALQLWVVGSYARGASTCADLDVVVNFTSKGAAPRPRVIQRKFFGALPLLRVYEDTPEKNRSGVLPRLRPGLPEKPPRHPAAHDLHGPPAAVHCPRHPAGNLLLHPHHGPSTSGSRAMCSTTCWR